MADHQSIPVSIPSTIPVPRAVSGLLLASQQGLADAEGARVAGERYALAHLAALRAAAAVLAARTRPQGRRGRPVSAWRLLTEVAPELGEWAAFFAAGAGKRAAAEAGRPVVSQREADDLIRDAERFLLAVLGLLGLVQQPSLSLSA
jgi:SAV_6107-like HEPN